MVFTFWGSIVSSQSDNCIDAELLPVEETCITKAGFTNDFIDTPLDNSCGGDTDDDGWYKFKAISTKTLIKVFSADGSDIGVSIFLDDCEQERTCTNSTTKGGIESINFSTQIGREYYIQVYDIRQGPGSFFICVSSPPKEPISDCDNAEVICTSGPIDFNPTGSGVDDFASELNDPGCLLSKENQSAWYYFEIQTTAPPDLFLSFSLTPDNSPDYDFAIFGPNVACTALSYPIRCSFADKDCELCPSTGLGMGAKDATENARGNGFVALLQVQPGEGFFLLIDNFSATATGFILEWGGTAAPFLNCEAETPCGLFVEAGKSLNVCEETEVNLQATIKGQELTEELSFLWEASNEQGAFLDDPTSPMPTLSFPNNFTGTLSYLVTASNGSCKHSDLLSIHKVCFSTGEECATPLKVNVDLISPSCILPKSGGIQIPSVEGGTAPYQFQLDDETYTSNSIFTKLEEGNYQLSVMDANGCLLDTMLELSAASLPLLDLGKDTTINKGTSIQLQANTNIPPKQISTIAWSNIIEDTCSTVCLTQSLLPPFSQNITATLTTVNGCKVSDEIEINVNPKFNIFIPNAFSPNGDGINDTFTIYTEAGITSIQAFKIFNRWGDLVFLARDISTNSQEQGWDGTFQNQLLNAGVFTYLVEIKMPDNTIERLMGDVTLIK